MHRIDDLRSILTADAARMCVLTIVAGLALPDCWVAAGFVRNAVWDHLHGRPALEATLRAHDGTLAWSVKNQARMHGRNDDAPYRSALDAMRHWPETATAVGVRLDASGRIEAAAPFGLDDLFGLAVRPTPRFCGDKRAVYLERVRGKGWKAAWPKLEIDDEASSVIPAKVHSRPE